MIFFNGKKKPEDKLKSAAAKEPEIIDKDSEEIAEFMEMFERIRTNKEKICMDNYLNIAAYVGRQVMWDNSFNKLVKRNEHNPYIPILNFNLNQRISRLIANKPKWEVEPEYSVDSADEQIARVTQKMINHIEKKFSKQQLRKMIQLWIHLTGICFEEQYWDGKKGNTDFSVYVSDGNDEEYSERPFENKNYRRVKKNQGDVVIDLWNWFEVFIDTNIKSIEETDTLILARLVSNKKIKEIFGADIFDRIKEKNGNSDDEKKNLFNGFNSIFDMVYGTSSIKKEDYTLVFKIYQRESDEYPEGRLLYIIKNQYVYKGINPTPNHQLPIVARYNIESLDSIWKKALTTDCRPLQEEYNSIRTQMRKTRRQSGNLTVLADLDTEIRVEQMKNYPGLIIRGPYYKGTNGASPLFTIDQRMRTDANDLQWQLNTTIDDLKNMLSIRLSSERSYLAERISGVALDKLNQADQTDLAWEIETIESQEIKSMILTLELIRHHYTAERIKSCIGDTFVYGFMDIKKLIVNSLRIEPYSMLPRDIVSKRNLLIQLLTLNPNFFNGISLEKLLEEIEFGGLEDIYAKNERQISKAMEENIRMLAGIYVKVDLLADNHDVEIPVHEDFLKSKELKIYLKSIVKINPLAAYQINENIKQHIAMHYQAKASKEQMQAGMINPNMPAMINNQTAGQAVV